MQNTPELKSARTNAITVSMVAKAAIHREATEIGRRRASSGLSLRDVAKYTGTQYHALYRAERGRPVSLVSALKIARFFECSVEELFGELLRS